MANAYHLVIKDINGKSRKQTARSEKAAQTTAINLSATGKYPRIDVVFQPTAKDKPSVLITYFPKNNIVWWSRGGSAGPVGDDGQSLSQEVLDVAPQYTEEFLTAPIRKPPPPEKPFNYNGLIVVGLGLGAIGFIARRARQGKA